MGDDGQLFSIAVLGGPDTGKVLRTRRARISVGAAADNDLTLTDRDVCTRHFVVLPAENDAGWRAQTYATDQRIVIDRSWRHPSTGEGGVLIYAGGSEILFFPGEIEDAAIQQEIRMRTGGHELVPLTGSNAPERAHHVAPAEDIIGDDEPPTTHIEHVATLNAWGDTLSDDQADAPVEPSAEPDREERQPLPESHQLAQPPEARPLHKVGISLSAVDLAALASEPALTIVREPDGDYATAIRLFGTRLEEMVRTFGYRAYMLSSAEPLTGKTTIACNLAFALAEDPVRRIALIEANFRHPRLGGILGVPENQGLMGVLKGDLEVADAIVKVSDRNLIIFPAGGCHPNPAELLASPRFKTLLTELADTVDIAIIDAPPVKPFADTNLLLPLVDGALLVMLEGSTRTSWVSQAMEQLGSERVLGALYNKVGTPLRRELTAASRERLVPRR